MLLLEFHGVLFQLDEREPAFDPLLQSPPKIAGKLCPYRPLRLLAVPTADSLPISSAASVVATRC